MKPFSRTRTSRLRLSVRASQRSVQQKIYSSLAVGIVATLVFACAAVLPHYTSFATPVAETKKSACTPDENRTICACVKENGSTEGLLATVSGKSNVLQISCDTNQTYAPSGLRGSKVCPAKAESLTTCIAGDKSSIDIASLLVNAPPELGWKPTTDQRGAEQPKILTIPEGTFPFTDEKFIVGCLNGERERSNTACHVTVKISARPTKTENQHVTCAYGAESNKNHQSITLSPSQNSFTLACGDKGEIVQTDYQERFCAVSGDKKAVTACTGDYKAILPSYERGWWAESSDQKQTFTLTIPEDKFPENEAKLMVQCQAASEAIATKGDAGTLEGPTVCSVDVTIQGAGPASSASAIESTDGTDMLLLLVGAGIFAH
ncbi:SAG-related sequence [Besnoitia besnoiti]|uniref:SAG-related sequence n=1 Tax=Besnoitia besnoiti TaxID=94643 RepID=A0A2A9MMK7_BESBE|nr:SAG-related sequence [Besnoitia besnoiti]PFH36820.1 SAG-related sequence [Besnoitia besnoiti]